MPVGFLSLLPWRRKLAWGDTVVGDEGVVEVACVFESEPAGDNLQRLRAGLECGRGQSETSPERVLGETQPGDLTEEAEETASRHATCAGDLGNAYPALRPTFDHLQCCLDS